MLHSIQALRAIAASAVALFHSIVLLNDALGLSFIKLTYTAGLGAAGVHIFFVVSGFIMMWTNQDTKRDWRSFLRKRFSRIYPSYWLIAALSIPLTLLIGQTLPGDIEAWIGSILLLPKGASAIIFVGWTLAYEVYFYIVFAALISLGLPLIQRAICMTVFFGASIFAGMIWPLPADLLFGMPKLATNTLLLEFVAGAWIGWAAIRGIKVSTGLAALMIVAGLAGFAASLWLDYNKYPAVILWGVPSILLVSGFVALEIRGLGHRLFRGLSGLGDSSYALYLIHAVLIPAFVFLLPISAPLSLVPFLALSLTIYAITLALSHLYFLGVETKLVRMSNLLFARYSSLRQRQL